MKIFWDGWRFEGDDESLRVFSAARVMLDHDIGYI